MSTVATTTYATQYRIEVLEINNSVFISPTGTISRIRSGFREVALPGHLLQRRTCKDHQTQRGENTG